MGTSLFLKKNDDEQKLCGQVLNSECFPLRGKVDSYSKSCEADIAFGEV